MIDRADPHASDEADGRAPHTGGKPEPDHFYALHAAERAAWDMLIRGANDRRHAFHQCTVATVTPDGLPAARTVVLRKADRAARGLRFHTDTRSRKFAELSTEPRCVIHFYDHGAKVQVRAFGTVTLHADDALTHNVWDAMRDFSRACYRQPVAPGAALAAPDGADGAPLARDDAVAHLVVCELAVTELEWLYLSAKGHRRARFTYGRDDRTEATWLAP